LYKGEINPDDLEEQERKKEWRRNQRTFLGNILLPDEIVIPQVN